MSDERTKRPKDVLKEYLRENQQLYDIGTSDGIELVPHLYSFVYWLEGQDLWDDDFDSPVECRYHVVTESESTCPFDFAGSSQP